MWVDLVFIAILAAVAVVDYLTKSIYDFMLIVGALICYPLLYFFRDVEILHILYGMGWGFCSYGLIFVIARWIYKDEVFGLGDVFLNIFICGYLGLIPGVIASFLTFFVALLLIVLQWIKTRSIKGELEVPLAPAMAISAVISLYNYSLFIDLIFYL